MKSLVFFLEEPSAREMLRGVVPRVIPKGSDIRTRYIVFNGKSDLEKQLEKRLAGWQLQNSRFVVLRDQDNAACETVKRNLLTLVKKARKSDCTMVRVACHELESFYLGDLAAVERALDAKGLARLQEKKKYRNPDEIVSPSDELDRITCGKYQKVAGSREIGPKLSLAGNRSHSFTVFIAGLRNIIDQMT